MPSTTDMKVSDEAVEAAFIQGWHSGPAKFDEFSNLIQNPREVVEAALTAAFAHFAAHPEQLPDGFWYAPVEAPKPDDCPACFGTGNVARPQIPETCGKCGGSGKV